MPNKIKLDELKEERFGMLKVLGFAPSVRTRKGKLITRVYCKCECGGSKTVDLKNLLSGNTQSCGCQAGGKSRRKWE